MCSLDIGSRNDFQWHNDGRSVCGGCKSDKMSLTRRPRFKGSREKQHVMLVNRSVVLAHRSQVCNCDNFEACQDENVIRVASNGSLANERNACKA